MKKPFAIFGSENIRDEFCELEHMGSQRLSAPKGILFVVKQLVVKHAEHGGART